MCVRAVIPWRGDPPCSASSPLFPVVAEGDLEARLPIAVTAAVFHRALAPGVGVGVGSGGHGHGNSCGGADEAVNRGHGTGTGAGVVGPGMDIGRGDLA